MSKLFLTLLIFPISLLSMEEKKLNKNKKKVSWATPLETMYYLETAKQSPEEEFKTIVRLACGAKLKNNDDANNLLRMLKFDPSDTISDIRIFSQEKVLVTVKNQRSDVRICIRRKITDEPEITHKKKQKRII
jgi:hypothetical protein